MSEIVSTKGNELKSRILLRQTMSEIVSTEGNEGDAAYAEQLLPGILNDITFGEIIPNLSWSQFVILSSVSPCWHHAIRTHQVYHARVRSNSVESLILFALPFTRDIVIVAYLMSDNSFLELPRIPPLREATPSGSQCVSLDGKIYILGGDSKIGGPCSDKVFVLDVAGQRNWKECACMKQPREAFGCRVIGGKIYVCGGKSDVLDKDGKYVGQIPSGSEVYEPQKNIWSSIKSMITLRVNHRVEIVGEELLVHGGVAFDPKSFDSTGKRITPNSFRHRARIPRDPEIFEMYHPGKDEWREVKPGERYGQEIYFGAGGKFFSLSKNGLPDIYDIHHVDILQGDQSLRTHLYSFSLAGILGFHVFTIVDVLPVDDELLARVWGGSVGTADLGFLKSRGFGSENKEITWHEVHPTSLDFVGYCMPFLRDPLKL